MNIKKYGYKIIYTRSKQKIRNEFVPRKGMNRLLMKRRSTISWKPPPARISRALSTFRNTRSMAFYLRVRNRATETRARARLEQLSVSKESLPRIAFLFGLLSARRRGKGGGGLEKFNRGKKASGYCVRCFVTKIRS